MRMSEIAFVALLIPAVLLGLSGAGVVTGHLDGGVLARTALVSVGPVLVILLSGFMIRRRAAALSGQGPVAAAGIPAAEPPLRRAA